MHACSHMVSQQASWGPLFSTECSFLCSVVGLLRASNAPRLLCLVEILLVRVCSELTVRKIGSDWRALRATERDDRRDDDPADESIADGLRSSNGEFGLPLSAVCCVYSMTRVAYDSVMEDYGLVENKNCVENEGRPHERHKLEAQSGVSQQKSDVGYPHDQKAR